MNVEQLRNHLKSIEDKDSLILITKDIIEDQSIVNFLKVNNIVCFFGDGATTQGAFHECINMAAIWNLPVVFINII